MNNRNMALSLMDNISTVSVIFNHGTRINLERLDTSMKQYTYAYNTEKLKLENGDTVIIKDAQNHLQFVTVVDVHEYNQIDVSASYDYKLVIDKVEYDADLEARLKEAMQVLNETARQAAKTNIVNTFIGNMSESARAKLNQVGISVDKGE